MTITADDYVNRVLDWLPGATPERDQIATELRGHIAERLAAGQPLDEVLRQLGDPAALAESYLSAVPLISAPFGRRAVAKLIDVAAIVAFIAPSVAFLFLVARDEVRPFLVLFGILASTIFVALYLVVAEAKFGYTLGKRLLGLRVVRESGARISIGQAVVRQLPMFMQMYWVDVLFALFTDKSQRAFELLSKTRVVIADSDRMEDTPLGVSRP
jgi:uncharacterized RDD family membrane protein YckC